MPANFPEVWLDQVETVLVTGDEAPWLDGIPEIASDVSQIHAGAESEINEIHIPCTDFEVDILINNNSYPLAVQEYDDDTITIRLDKYQTKQVPLSDDQVIGAGYDLISTATGIMTTNIVERKYAKAIHSLAPLANAADTPVIVATGDTGKKDNNGDPIILKDGNRLCLTWKDVLALKKKCDKAPKRWPKNGRRLVLCTDHYNDLLADAGKFADILANKGTGEVAPVILGFSIYQHIEMPGFDGTDKLPFGTALDAGQYEGSVAFHVQNVGKKTGVTRQYFSPASTDAANQGNRVSYRHYFIVVPKRARYIAAIASQDDPGV